MCDQTEYVEELHQDRISGEIVHGKMLGIRIPTMVSLLATS